MICVTCQRSDDYGACIPYGMEGQMFRRRRMWQLGERCPLLPPAGGIMQQGKVRVGQQKQKKKSR